MSAVPPVPPAPLTSPPPELVVPLPAGWRRRSDPTHGVVVAARPRRPGPAVPQVVVRCVPVAATDVVRWRVEALDELAHRLADFALEDDDVYDTVAGEAAYHRFAHREDGPGDDVLCEQWSWLLDGWGVTLTCSVARIDYPAWCDVFESIAESVDLVRAAA